MASLAIINPKKRRKARKAKAGKAKTYKAKRRSNPVAKRRKRPTKAAASRAARTLHRRRRNPLGGSALKDLLLPAAMGATGAAIVSKGLDMIQDRLPAAMQSGFGRYATEAGAALLVGLILDKTKAVKPATRNAIVGGALTITAYRVLDNEVLAKIDGMTMAPAPTVKGFQAGSLMGFQPGTLMEMPASGMVLTGNERQFV